MKRRYTSKRYRDVNVMISAFIVINSDHTNHQLIEKHVIYLKNKQGNFELSYCVNSQNDVYTVDDIHYTVMISRWQAIKHMTQVNHSSSSTAVMMIH